MGLAHSPRIVTDGLVLCLDAANTKSYPGSGTTWTDLSSASNVGTLVDGPTFSSADSGSLVFDGLNDRVHIPSASDRFTWTPSGAGLNNMTIEFFVKSNDTNDGFFISKPWNGNGEYNYYIKNNNFYNQIGNQSHSLNYTSISSTSWQHICAISTPTQKAIYRNGVVYVNFTNHGMTNNIPTSGNGSIPLCLMSLYPYNSGWVGNTAFSIEGNMSLIRIYNRVLSADEVLQNFNALRGRYGI